MKEREPSNDQTAEGLIARYVEIGIAQAEVIDEFDSATFNRLFAQRREIARMLKSLPGDQRRQLVSLFGHKNWQVCLNAVGDTLAVAPTEARAELERIKASKHHPQAMDAGMWIRGLDDGSWKPT